MRPNSSTTYTVTVLVGDDPYTLGNFHISGCEKFCSLLPRANYNFVCYYCVLQTIPPPQLNQF